MTTLRAGWRFSLFALLFPAIAQVVWGAMSDGLTYLSLDALLDLAEAVIDVERRQLAGIIIEAGVALGGSAIVLAAAKNARRPLFAYDVFAMIPPPSAKDGPDVRRRYQEIASGASAGIAGGVYYGYRQNLYKEVLGTLERFGFNPRTHHISLIKGAFENTLKVNMPVVLAHIDCDWYESVLTCLKAIGPRLVRGGRMIIDDYDSWTGCKDAVDEYLSIDDKATFTLVRKHRLHILKN